MKLIDYIKKTRAAEQMARDTVREMMPAFPKPHIRPIGGGIYRCVRVVEGDEFFAAFGASAVGAYEAAQNLRADPSLDLLWLMARPDWVLENA